MRKAHLALCALLFICGSLVTASARPVRNLPVAMRDGNNLLTDYELPDGSGPFPVILIRTPYTRMVWFGALTVEGQQAGAWIEQGFAVVVQNTRGTWGSDSEDLQPWPFYNEGWVDAPERHMHPDGIDCMEWLLDQPWCNGTVLTYGGSAPGITSQLLAGATQAIAGQIMKYSGVNFYEQLGREGGVIRREQMNWYILERCMQIIDDVEAHPYYDDYWASFDVTAPGRVERITAPGLHIGGWFDVFAEGTIHSFLARQHSGGTGARGNQKLIMGPTSHWGSIGMPLEFPDAEFPMLAQYERAFLEYWGQGADNGFDELPNVTYYTMGAVGEPEAPGNEWRTSASWPPAAATTMTWYLHPDKALRRVPVLAESTERMVFRYDPRNACPTIGGRTLFPQNAFDFTQSTWFPGPQDQRALGRRPDVLRLTTPVLVHPLEVTGSVAIRLFISSDAPDTDFTAKLVDVYPDGREMLILDSIQRVKLRNGYIEPDPLLPGNIGELNFSLGNTSILFNKGHRIGLHISSSNYPRFDMNPNNGDDLMGEHPPNVATNVVHASHMHASMIVLSTPDTDGDGVIDHDELRFGLDPFSADTDRDGVSDRDEINQNRNPTLPDDGEAAFEFVAQDGVALATWYAVPAGAPPYPVMVARTPYGIETLMGEAHDWRTNGYAVVLQETRGGDIPWFEADGWGPVSDSSALVDWITGQAWCDGQIGISGEGADGAVATLAAGASRSVVATSIAYAPASIYGQWAYQGGVPRGEFMPVWDVTGLWRATPEYSPFWAQHDAAFRAPFIESAGLHIGGWFDPFLQGTIDSFVSRQHNGGDGARGHQHLVIGPESAAGPVGELAFPNAATNPDRRELMRTFHDHYLRGNPGTLPYRVKYYMMGAVGEGDAPGNEWRTAQDWPPYDVAHRKYYLVSEDTLSTVSSHEEGFSSYDHSPDDPVPAHGGLNMGPLNGVGPGPRDQRAVNAGRNDVLRFATETLATPVEIVGPVRARLFVSATADDTDFTAKLVDIYPDGSEMLFADGIQRLKFRDGFTEADPLPPGTVGEIEIDLWSTALVVNAGHRIGLQISSSNAPRFEPHPLVSRNTVYWGGATPSALMLPVAATADVDGDGLDESAEATANTDPLEDDSDDDGCSDGKEIAGRSDPRDPASNACTGIGTPTYVLLSTQSEGNGSIVIADAVKNPVQIAYGTEAVLTAIPDDGWRFDGWYGDIDDLVIENPLTCRMDHDRTVGARFVKTDDSQEGCAWCCHRRESDNGSISEVLLVAMLIGAALGFPRLERKGSH